jgi:hypothetical protein
LNSLRSVLDLSSFRFQVCWPLSGRQQHR